MIQKQSRILQNMQTVLRHLSGDFLKIIGDFGEYCYDWPYIKLSLILSSLLKNKNKNKKEKKKI